MITEHDLKSVLKGLDCFIDNEYLDLYIKLIIKNQNNSIIKHKTNNHHIIPKAYYKFKNLPIDNSNENICTLVYTDHIKAHYYLLHCTCGKLKSSSFLAFQFICGKYLDKDNITLEDFDWEYIQRCHEETYIFMSESRKNIPKSEETKQKISIANKGRKVSKETKMQLSKSLKGRTPWNKGGKGIITKGCRGQHWYNNGEINILSFDCPEGFVLGRIGLKGHKQSAEARAKMSAAKKGKYLGSTNNKAHAVDMLDLDGNFIRHFDTIKEAQEFVGAVGIRDVIVGRQKTCGGYKWRSYEKEIVCS